VLFSQESFRKDLWIDNCDSSRESKEPNRLEGDKERSCERILARGPIGLHQFGIKA
jgi:hypothetical protein